MRMIPIASCCMFFNSFLRHSPRHVLEGNLVLIHIYKALRSAGGIRRPLRLLRKEK